MTPVSGWLLRFDRARGEVTVELGLGSSAAGAAAAEGNALRLTRADAVPSVVAAGDVRPDATRERDGRAAEARATWDPSAGRLTLHRDRTGAYPLFHAEVGETLVASTDLRTLLAVEGVGRRPDPVAVGCWIASAPLDPSETLYANVRRLPAGHSLTADARGTELERVWAPPPPGSHPRDAGAGFGSVLEAAIERLAERGRFAVFLSGGVDSACVAAAAAAVSARVGLPPPLALCVTMEGADESVIQRHVAGELGLELVTGAARAEPGLLARGLERAERSLWPTVAPWAPAFDELAERAVEAGAEVLLDGQGGDDLLDAGIHAAAALGASPRALVEWLLAERRYTGATAAPLRAIGRAVLRRPAARGAADLSWLEPAVARAVAQRLERRPAEYGAIRADDLTDAVLASQREETRDAGAARGLLHRHPLWDAGVVELLDGLPPRALVAGGQPKSPARVYLARRIPSLRGVWPRPALATTLTQTAFEQEAARLWDACGRGRRLGQSGVVAPGSPIEGFHNPVIWPMLSLERWIPPGEREWFP